VFCGYRLRHLFTLLVVLATASPGLAARQVSAVTPQQLEEIRSLATQQLAERVSELGLKPGDLTISGSTVDPQSFIHVRVQQSRDGVPVLGGEAILHYRANGELFGETNDLVPNIRVDTTPKLSAAAAIARSTTAEGCSDCLTGPPSPALWILRREGKDHLTYRVQLRRLDGSGRSGMPVLFVDAHDGHVVLRYDDLQTGKR
jgi:Zn-dependent metalloprotease